MTLTCMHPHWTPVASSLDVGDDIGSVYFGV